MIKDSFQNYQLFEQSTPDHWAERWGSYIITGTLGVLAVIVLNLTIINTPPPKSYQPEIIFALSPALPEPPNPILEEEVEDESEVEEIEQIEEPELQFEEAVATTVNETPDEPDQEIDHQQGETLEEAQESPSEISDDIPEETLVAMANPKPLPLVESALFPKQPTASEDQEIQDIAKEISPILEDWKPQTARDIRRLDAIAERLRDDQERIEAKAMGVESEVNRRMLEAAGRQFLFNSDGGEQGMIRLLDVEGFPEDLVRRVLGRYGITIQYRKISAADLEDRRTYFNAVAAENGDFTSITQDGYYEVFSLSSKSLAMLSAIERRHLSQAKLNPATTRVRKIEFGIVLDEEGEYALGVTEMETEVIQMLPLDY